MSGAAARWARVAAGHAAVVIPRAARKSRRLTSRPLPELHYSGDNIARFAMSLSSDRAKPAIQLAQTVTYSARRANHFPIFGNRVKPRKQKYSASYFCKSEVEAMRLIPEEGRRPSSPHVGMGCGGRFCSADERTRAYGEVVWFWRRDAGAKLVELSASDGDNKPAPPGRARSKP